MLKIAWTPDYNHPLPPTHRFPMEKYDLLPEQLIYEGTIAEANLFQPPPLDEYWVLRTHHADYWQRLKYLQLSRREQRTSGFPHDAQLIHRELVITEGTRQACHFALEHGIAMNIAGGTHHAFADRGEGFCLLNDIAVASNYLLDKGLAQRILVIDLDVHQGNGTAALMQNEERVFTFSMHGENNYPLRKQSSDRDLGLPIGMEDGPYLKLLRYHLPQVLELFQPDFLFFQSGVDILASDKLGKLGISKAGCRERDHFVLQTACAHQIPLVVNMGGGYSPKLTDILEAHANTYRIAQFLYF